MGRAIMKVFCKNTPENIVGYVTPYKIYDVIAQDGDLLVIVDDEGDLITIHTSNCAHIKGQWVELS